MVEEVERRQERIDFREYIESKVETEQGILHMKETLDNTVNELKDVKEVQIESVTVLKGLKNAVDGLVGKVDENEKSRSKAQTQNEVDIAKLKADNRWHKIWLAAIGGTGGAILIKKALVSIGLL